VELAGRYDCPGAHGGRRRNRKIKKLINNKKIKNDKGEFRVRDNNLQLNRYID